MLKTETASAEKETKIIFIMTVMKLMTDCIKMAGTAILYILAISLGSMRNFRRRTWISLTLRRVIYAPRNIAAI